VFPAVFAEATAASPLNASVRRLAATGSSISEVQVADVVSLFREWSGDEQFAKFVGALQTTRRRKGELVFWQEHLWDRFSREQQLDLPRDYEGVANIFASVAEVGREVTFCFPPEAEVQLSAQPLRTALLDWASRRSQAHLRLEAHLLLTAGAPRHRLVADLVQHLFSTDPDVRRCFAGAVVSVSFRTPDGQPPLTGLTVAVDSSSQDGLVSLGWGIASRQKPKPWWRFWQ
jgi:hypothetical protein